MKNYITIKELIQIYNIPQKTVDTILKKHKIDTYQSKKGLAVNFKDFYKVYTSLYNPSLFVNEKKTLNGNKGEKTTIFTIFEKLFLNIFKRPYKKMDKIDKSNQNTLF